MKNVRYGLLYSSLVRPTRLTLLACAASVALWVESPAGAAEATGRLQPFTVIDAIERAEFQYFGGEGRTVLFSPDRQRLAVLLQRGELQSQSVRSDLLVFDAETVLAFVRGQTNAAPAPRTVATLRSTSNRPAITEVRWSDQGRALVFLGERAGELPQVYRFDLTTNRLVQLTQEAAGVAAYGHDAGATVVSVPQPDEELTAERKPFVVRGEGLRDLMGLKSLVASGHEPVAVRTRVRMGESPWVDVPFFPARGDGSFQAAFQGASISPDGTQAVTLRIPSRVPPAWGGYAFATPLRPTEDPSAVPYTVMQWTAIDLRSGHSRILMDTPFPFGIAYRSYVSPGGVALWRREGRSVILSDVLLPLDGSEERRAQPHLIEMDLDSGRWQVIAPFPRRNARGEFSGSGLLRTRWDSRQDRLLAWISGNNASTPIMEFRRLPNGRWREREVTDAAVASFDGALSVEVRQTIDQPPRLMAKDTRTGREALLLDPNPTFSERTFGAASVLEFKDAAGRPWRAGLVLPVDYRKGTRYPLVIQTHGFSSREFLVQGNGTTGYAAQALANRGMAVLQLQDQTGVVGRADEPLIYMAGYEAAVQRLADEGIADAERVGIMGFSRTCFHVRYALVHSKQRFAAAVIHDGVDYGYLSFLAGFNFLPDASDEHSARTASFALLWGGKPYGEALQRWIERVPSFNLHRVQTPVTIEAIGTLTSPLFEWEWYVGLRQLGKPVEMRFIPGGTHELFRPQDQYFSQQGNVDWFDFWLNGREDRHPDKAAQYERWRAMRAT